ncbi:MAG: acyl-CoA dehydrogenase family protein [Byssovorax sp.]
MDDDVVRARIAAVKLLDVLLSTDPAVAEVPSIGAWWRGQQRVVAGGGATIDHAILGGYRADRVAYAFAAGYQAALRLLAPDLPADRLASLCVTERGGGHPRAIETRLTPENEGFLVRGSKRWATLSGGDDVAGVLLVAAVTGELDALGRPQIRVARVNADAPGVQVTPMPPTPFTPEILHGEVRLDDARVAADALLAGDGYRLYIKPFRTIEDLHIQGAITGYLIGEARRGGFPRAIVERLAAQVVTLRGLAAGDPGDAAGHVALAGALRTMAPLVTDLEAAWAVAGGPAYARWQRDRLLVGIAESARVKRLERAWARLAGEGEVAD